MRKTLAQALAETQALGETRRLSAARVSRSRREANAQRPPSAGTAAYTSVMETYTKRVSKAVERHVIGALPVLGSGDPLDVAALQRGIEALRIELLEMSHSIRRSAGAAFSRTTQHARREAARILGVTIPAEPQAERLAREAFIERQVRALQRAAEAQVRAIQKAIATYPEGTSLRKRIEHQLWVTRERGKLIARNEVWKLAEEEVKRWAILAGAEGGIYHTRHDELVRPSHAIHDGVYYPYGQEPPTLGEPNCRCRMYPVTAATLGR